MLCCITKKKAGRMNGAQWFACYLGTGKVVLQAHLLSIGCRTTAFVFIPLMDFQARFRKPCIIALIVALA
ncbi:LIN1-like protein [Fusarium oxysporum f. sp. albedinis]|nr:LIN1-like protein [Fusarium oxysporum f. sp. albedinis]